jgi:hypothetical protein
VPVTLANEAEFDRWFNQIHVPEVSGLPGVAAVRRFTTAAQLLPLTWLRFGTRLYMSSMTSTSHFSVAIH